MLRVFAFAALISLCGIASPASAQTGDPYGGGFYGDIYRDGGCWYAGYNHCRFRSEYKAAPYIPHFAVSKDCYQMRPVETSHGVRMRRVFVCNPIQ